MALKPLLIRITGDDTKLSSAIERSQRNLKRLSVAAAATGAAVAAGLSAATKASLDNVDATTKLARAANASYTAMRGLQQAAGYAGVSLEEVNSAATRLAQQLSTAAANGGPVADALRSIGLTAEELLALDIDERFARIADRVTDLGLSSAEAGALLRTMGIEGKQVALLIAQSGDAIRGARREIEQFGVALTAAQTGAIESANDAIARTALVFEGLRNQLAAEVAPTLQTVADRLTELGRSTATQEAIEALVTSFANLAEVVLDDQFVTAAAGMFSGLVDTAASVASAMVTVSENIEMVTTGLVGLTLGLAAFGGPVTLVIGSLVAALAGISAWRMKTDEAAEATDQAAKRTRDLNAALDAFRKTGAPDAADEAEDLAKQNVQLAQSALDAAEAELALAQASIEAAQARRGAAIFQMGSSAVDEFSFLDADAIATANAEIDKQTAAAEAATKRIAAAQIRLDEAAQALASTRETLAGGGPNLPGALGPDGRPALPPAPDDDPATGTGGGLGDTLAGQIDMIRTSLLTQSEILIQSRDEQLAILREGYEQRKIDQIEFLELSAQIEQQYAERSAQVQQMQRQQNLAAYSSFFGELAGVAEAGGKKMFGVMKAASIAQATVSMLAGANFALAQPFPQSLAAWAAVLKTGVGAVNSIKGTNIGSSGGGAAPPPAPTITNNFSPNISVTATGTNATPEAIATAVSDQLSGALQQLIQRGGVFT